VTGLTIEVKDPAAAARRWAEVLGVPEPGRGHTTVELPGPGQRLRFVAAPGGRGEGITEVTIAGLPGKRHGDVGAGPWVIGGVRFAGEDG
jgi:catechol 2,3-dioxygenase-like lactoylglutathione lyase family enzyme